MNMSAKPKSIFVYGTLKKTGVRHHLWPCFPVRIVRARIRGTLYDLGPYPALTLSGTDWIEGERWEIADEDMSETLRMLDNIEGYGAQSDDLYERCVIDCIDEDDSVHQAYTYQFAQTDKLSKARRIVPNAKGVCTWPDQPQAERTE
jgi:gamma-glutamylcyclotransferase (GGCT)/AIG2-like uncharacterized protein YtfP